MSTAQTTARPSSLVLALPGKAPSTPSSPRNNAAPAPTAPRTPTTAPSDTSSAQSPEGSRSGLASGRILFAHGVGLSGREPSPVTVGARLSCISSFFKFLIRLDLLKANPCDPVERPKPRPSAPSGLSASQVQSLLEVIPDTVKGRRDLAIVLTLVLTGRRRSEVINLTAGDVSFDESAVFYRYIGKGGVRGRRELPAPALSAIGRSLGDRRQGPLVHATFRVALAGGRWSFQGVSSATFYNRFRGYLGEGRLSLLPASTSSATPPPSSAATSASRSSP